MHHRESSLELDVHHNLIQLTSRNALDVAPMIARSQEVAGTPFRVLAPSDMVLHSVLHLLMSDELRGGIRDLFDIHSLCQHFAAQHAGFWSDLVTHGRELGLMRPLYYALSAAREIFGLSPPAEAWDAISEARPMYPIDRLMLGLMRWHLAPAAYDARRAAFVEQLLYVRSHWVRMPPHTLLRHLLHKSALALRGKSAT